MEYLLRILVDSFPVGLSAILTLAGILLIFFERWRKSGKRLLASGAFLFLFCIFSPLGEILTRSLEKQYRPLQNAGTGLGIRRIVVLAGYGEEHPGQSTFDSVSDETLRRIVEGVRLYRRIPGAKLIVPGGVVRSGDRPISEIMASAMLELGVSPADIVLEKVSFNTRMNLIHVKMILGATPFILVTSACDMPRAMAISRKLQMNPVPAPACAWALRDFPADMTAWTWFKAVLRGFTRPSFTRLARLQWTLHEYVGMLWYHFRGWL